MAVNLHAKHKAIFSMHSKGCLFNSLIILLVIKWRTLVDNNWWKSLSLFCHRLRFLEISTSALAHEITNFLVNILYCTSLKTILAHVYQIIKFPILTARNTGLTALLSWQRGNEQKLANLYRLASNPVIGNLSGLCPVATILTRGNGLIISKIFAKHFCYKIKLRTC